MLLEIEKLKNELHIAEAMNDHKLSREKVEERLTLGLRAGTSQAAAPDRTTLEDAASASPPHY